ncbi:hypothetical protein QEZ54_34040 [Catellatospora sp. KI3]|uniref:hypothetical protein n=1 Tax=Catellatospora sp. KI3 TaxID=3041620 RepID=UPI0024822CE2|nr:hypothetical protein [Catellatospora sp. KI3]MDI1466009.1 hypothetical protein [Catellatospora sp. KI3]
MVQLVYVTAALAVALLVYAAADGPVSRARLGRFARRHALWLTVDNGPRVIAYLAATRRWRAAGVTFGFVLYTLPWLAEDRFGVNFTYLLAGWFAGALLAEARLARPVAGPRAASLLPRTPARYLPPLLRWALPAAALLCLVLAGSHALRPQPPSLTGAAPSPARYAVWLGTTAVVLLLVRLATRAVLHRPQPVAAPDVVAADDAVRSRSLHVLAAAGTALVLYCVVAELALLAGDEATAVVLIMAGAVGVPLLGWRLATRPWTVAAGAAG